MTDSNVAISAHDGEEDGAGELVDAGCGHVGLAHEVAEWPRLPAHCCEQEGNADKEALVRHRQIHDVHVGHCLHLGETNYHVDDERVA